jgi:hypothetical protein
MKTIKIKSGTKAEIVKYMRAKVTDTVLDVTNGAKSFGEVGVKFKSWNYTEKDVVELESNSIEKQIDAFVESGSPIVVISLAGKGGVGYHREQFLLTDYDQLRDDWALEKVDNTELRDRRLKQIKMLIDMEMESEERWERILEITNDYKGETVQFIAHL